MLLDFIVFSPGRPCIAQCAHGHRPLVLSGSQTMGQAAAAAACVICSRCRSGVGARSLVSEWRGSTTRFSWSNFGQRPMEWDVARLLNDEIRLAHKNCVIFTFFFSNSFFGCAAADRNNSCCQLFPENLDCKLRFRSKATNNINLFVTVRVFPISYCVYLADSCSRWVV